ncbi:MAG: ParB/RepB/Spo0J family partition protein [Acidimicrobiia bacterium]
MRIVEIAVSQLVAARWNPNHMDARMLARLQESISRFGVVENLVARPTGNGLYEVLSGNQRLQILRELGHQIIPCLVVDLDDTQARLLAQALNRIEGEDDLGLKAELVRNVLKAVPQTDLLSLLPETKDSLEALVSLGEADLTEHLRNWERTRGARLHTLQLRLTDTQLRIVQRALEMAMCSQTAMDADGQNRRSRAITDICRAYLSKAERTR